MRFPGAPDRGEAHGIRGVYPVPGGMRTGAGEASAADILAVMAAFSGDSSDVWEPVESAEKVPDPAGLGAPGGDSSSGRRGIWIGVALLAVAAVAGWFVLGPGFGTRAGPAPPSEPVAEAAPEDPGPALPALDESDGLLRTLLEALMTGSEGLGWLRTDEIARRVAIATDNVADGVSPRRALSRLAPDGMFETRATEAGVEVDPASFARYDGVTAVIAEADIALVATTLDDLMPLLERAYAELGRPDRGFAEALLLALERLLTAPVPQSPILLRQETLRYEFAEAEIEALDPASKHLVRFGPDNQRRIQAALAPLVEHLRLRARL